jgi:hypothetical protein
MISDELASGSEMASELVSRLRTVQGIPVGRGCGADRRGQRIVHVDRKLAPPERRVHQDGAHQQPRDECAQRVIPEPKVRPQQPIERTYRGDER